MFQQSSTPESKASAARDEREKNEAPPPGGQKEDSTPWAHVAKGASEHDGDEASAERCPSKMAEGC